MLPNPFCQPLCCGVSPLWLVLRCHSPVVGLCPSTPHRSLYYLPSEATHLPLTVALTGLLSVSEAGRLSLSSVPSSRPRERDSQSTESRTRIARAHRVLLLCIHSLLRLSKGLCIPHLFYQERTAFSAEDTKNKAQLLPDLRPALPCQETIAAACIRLRRLQSPILGHSNQSLKTQERQTRLPFYRSRN